MTELQHGEIVLYSYLWAREHDRGEETGRKARPTCVMLILVGKDGRRRPLLFPITSQPPGSSGHVVEIPETEARRAKLYTPAWVVVDEFNTDDLAASSSPRHGRSRIPSHSAGSRGSSWPGSLRPPPLRSGPERRAASRGDRRSA